MKILEWINFFNSMKLKSKKAYTLTEIANIDNTSIKSAKTILQRLKKNKILLNIYKNIWAVPDADINDIAPFLDPDCYCSMETALYNYNIIKQSTQTFHFISNKFSKKKKTAAGIIHFHKIKNNLYFGFKNHFAEPEKALLDYIYFCIKDGRKPFVDYDILDISAVNNKKLQKYSEPFPKTTRAYLNKLSAGI